MRSVLTLISLLLITGCAGTSQRQNEKPVLLKSKISPGQRNAIRIQPNKTGALSDIQIDCIIELRRGKTSTKTCVNVLKKLNK